jgi:CBS domain-containing protein
MKTAVVTVDPRDNLLEADRLMRLSRIRHLPVAHEGELVGVISHRDVMEASLASLEEPSHEERLEHLRRVPVEQIIKGPARTVEPGCSARDAVVLMLRLKIGCLPVVENAAEGAKLVGIITESDLLRTAYVPEYAD